MPANGTTFSRALRGLLALTGTKQGHLATEARVHATTVSGWCSGAALPHVGRMAEIEQALRLTPKEKDLLREAYDKTAAAAVGRGE